MISILGKKLTFITLFFLAISTIVCAAPLEKEGETAVFAGRDDHSNPFEITLTRFGETVSGSYSYAGSPTSENVEGRISPEGVLKFVETKHGNIYGQFQAKLTGSVLEGEWSPVGAVQTISFTAAEKAHQVRHTDASPVTVGNESAYVSRLDFRQQAVEEMPAKPLPTNFKSALEGEPSQALDQRESNHEDSKVLQYILIGWLSVVIIGVLLGINDKIVVFRNYNDMAIAFCTGLSIVAIFFLMIGTGGTQHELLIFLCALVALCILWTVGRTIVDNRNPIYAIIALITKLTLFVLFIFNLIDFVTPGGKTTRERAASRRSSFIMLLIIAPITIALVKDKTGVFSPDKMMRRR